MKKEIIERWKNIYKYLCSHDIELVRLGLTILLEDEECWEYTLTQIKYLTDVKTNGYVYLGSLYTKLKLSDTKRSVASGMLLKHNLYYFVIRELHIDVYLLKSVYLESNQSSN